MTDYLQNIIAFFRQTHNQTTRPGRLIRPASVNPAAYIQQIYSPSLYPAQASVPASIYSGRVLLPGLFRIEKEFLHRQAAVQFILGHKDLRMAAKFITLARLYIRMRLSSWTVRMRVTENVASSGSIVTVTLPAKNPEAHNSS
ncbi:MAG: hypothetical protein ABSC47_11635 [Terracidiphilus sp.]|jgi:hypothetical protein